MIEAITSSRICDILRLNSFGKISSQISEGNLLSIFSNPLDVRGSEGEGKTFYFDGFKVYTTNDYFSGITFLNTGIFFNPQFLEVVGISESEINGLLSLSQPDLIRSCVECGLNIQRKVFFENYLEHAYQVNKFTFSYKSSEVVEFFEYSVEIGPSSYWKLIDVA